MSLLHNVWRRGNPDDPGERRHGCTREKRAAPSQKEIKARNHQNHEPGTKKNGSAVQTLGQMEPRSGNRFMGVPCTRYETRAGTDACEDFPKKKLPIGGGECNTEVADDYPGQSG